MCSQCHVLFRTCPAKRPHVLFKVKFEEMDFQRCLKSIDRYTHSMYTMTMLSNALGEIIHYPWSTILVDVELC